MLVYLVYIIQNDLTKNNLYNQKIKQKLIINLNGKEHDIIILHKAIENQLDIILNKKNLYEEINKDKIILFNVLKDYLQIINDCIDYVNKKNSITFIQKYFNDFTDSNKIIINPPSVCVVPFHKTWYS